jgi:hypothetical protein
LFSVFERAAISLAVMFLFGLGADSVFFDQRHGPEFRWWLPDFLDSFGIPFPEVRELQGRIVFLGMVAFGVDCFRRLRREPLTVSRNLWFLVAALLLGGAFLTMRACAGEMPFLSREIPFLLIYWIRDSVAALVPVALALTTVTLAGELEHTARLRMTAAQLNEDAPAFPDDLRRLQRHQPLVATVRGASFWIYAAMGLSVGAVAAAIGAMSLVWTCMEYLRIRN